MAQLSKALRYFIKSSQPGADNAQRSDASKHWRSTRLLLGEYPAIHSWTGYDPSIPIIENLRPIIKQLFNFYGGAAHRAAMLA